MQRFERSCTPKNQFGYCPSACAAACQKGCIACQPIRLAIYPFMCLSSCPPACGIEDRWS
jgi:hypothetical protein